MKTDNRLANIPLEELDPLTISVREDLPRYRKDLGKIEKLVASIQKYGQLQPILINRNKELIAGGRRLAASIVAGIKVKVVYNDVVDPILMREMELEENLQRENLLPAEEVAGVNELHNLKQQIHGVAISGKKDSGWTLGDTAELMGKSIASIAEDLALASALERFPELRNASTKSEIRKAVKGYDMVNKRLESLHNFEDVVQSVDQAKIVCMDALEHMNTVSTASIDILFTDPPWGINIDKNAIGIEGATGGYSTVGIKYTDDTVSSLHLYTVLARESFRFCKDTAHAFIFVAPEFFWILRTIFEEAGWNVAIRPIIWCKREVGQNNQPERWFSSTYEMILFARRVDSKLVIQGKPDWLQIDPVLPTVRRHPSEKPIYLIKEMIVRSCLPNQTLYDPFMGSGVTLEAALDMDMLAVGCDNDPASYSIAAERIAQWKIRRLAEGS